MDQFCFFVFKEKQKIKMKKYCKHIDKFVANDYTNKKISHCSRA
jgi:hypothetical protein